MTDVEYPRWVDHPTEIAAKTKDGKSIPKRLIVKSKTEEDELLSKKVDKSSVSKKSDGWSKE